MIETVILLIIAGLLIACALLPQGRPSQAHDDSPASDSLTVNEFLTNLQSDIESSLFPRPTDSVLKRHYDALVAAELENRLAAMPD